MEYNRDIGDISMSSQPVEIFFVFFFSTFVCTCMKKKGSNESFESTLIRYEMVTISQSGPDSLRSMPRPVFFLRQLPY